MATTISNQPEIAFVDSTDDLVSLLDTLTGLAVTPPSLYLGLKGVRLGAHGSISMISLYVLPKKKFYLIDISSLGKAAFLTANGAGTSLKTIFESPTIPKVVFDIRNNSAALFSLYDISVNGIEDIQLMELAIRKGSQRFVAGLVKCVENDGPFSAAVKTQWKGARQGTSQLDTPGDLGHPGVLDDHITNAEVMHSDVRDVAVLPGLYGVYKTKLSSEGFWQSMVSSATRSRIKLSQKPGYDGQEKSKTHGPWDKTSIEEAMESWNDDILLEIREKNHLDDDPFDRFDPFDPFDAEAEN